MTTKSTAKIPASNFTVFAMVLKIFFLELDKVRALTGRENLFW